MLISVIVPVYNVEKYLHYAIESLLNQTYKNFEIIIIDDGSTDLSGKLCDNYEKQFNNIKVYHIENGGLSSARNFGVNKSKGDFVVFLDPDDYLEPYTLELMNRIQVKYDADIVCTKVQSTFQYMDYSGKTIVTENDIDNVMNLSTQDALIEMFYDVKATVSACGKLFRRDIFELTKFPVGKIYEDLAIVSEYSLKSRKIIITEEKAYKYYKRPGSIVNSEFTEARYDFFDAIERNRKYINESLVDNSSVISALDAKLVKGSFSIINIAMDNGKKEAIYNIKKRLSSKWISILKNTRLSFKFKIKFLVFVVFPQVYMIIRRGLKKYEG
ncbi:MAG: glycosyltransferase family 2 protein [Gemella haemolysans]|uniref:glycosyltransferase family 2 protein n=1 Tax=Gemella haemolysans TaxID=1379 RepID=UPI003F9FDFDB